MDKVELKRKILDQSGKALRQFLARSAVAIIEYRYGKLIAYGSGTCIYYRGHYLIMTAAHVIEDASPENLSLVYKEGPSNEKVQVESIHHWKDLSTGLDVGFLVLSPEVARSIQKNFLKEDNFDITAKNLSTDLVALNGFPNGLFEHDGKKHYKFGSFTFVTACEEMAKWHQPIDVSMQIEFGYPDVATDAQTNQPFTMPEIHGMSGGGMWVLNINPKGIWSPESSCKLVGITAVWSSKREFVRGNRVEHWFRFADKILDGKK
jgi:hypothetical protein